MCEERGVDDRPKMKIALNADCDREAEGSQQVLRHNIYRERRKEDSAMIANVPKATSYKSARAKSLSHHFELPSTLWQGGSAVASTPIWLCIKRRRSGRPRALQARRWWFWGARSSYGNGDLSYAEEGSVCRSNDRYAINPALRITVHGRTRSELLTSPAPGAS